VRIPGRVGPLRHVSCASMVEETWRDQELPILEAVGAGEVRGELLDSLSAGAAAGLTGSAAARAVQALVENGYLVGAYDDDISVIYEGYFNLRLTGEGRRAVGQWPADPATRLLAELDRRIAAEADPGMRLRLERARSTLGDMGKQVLAEVLATVLTRGIGALRI
jgi:hypothetical protein